MIGIFGSAFRAMGSNCCVRDKTEEDDELNKGDRPILLPNNAYIGNNNEFELEDEQMVLEDSQQNNNQQQQEFSSENQQHINVKQAYRQKKTSQQNSQKQNTSSNMYETASKPHKSSKKNVKNWSKQEDDILKACILKYPGDWNTIALNIGSRNAQQCKQRWTRIQPQNKNRKHWTPEEDELVKRRVQEMGEDQRKWGVIAEEIGNGRNGKQVRERYINVLDESINRGKWEQKEDELIVQQFLQIGPKWSEMSKLLPGRPENMIKNRFHSHIKKTLNDNLKQDYVQDIQDQFQNNEYETTNTGGDLQNIDTYSEQMQITSTQVPLSNQYQTNSVNNLEDVPIKMEENGQESIFHPQNLQNGTNNMIDNNYIQNRQITKNNSSFYNNALINNNGVLQEQVQNVPQQYNYNQNGENINNNINNQYANQQNGNQNNNYNNNNNNYMDQNNNYYQNNNNQYNNNMNNFLSNENHNNSEYNESNGQQKNLSLPGSCKQENIDNYAEDGVYLFGADNQQVQNVQFKLSQSISSGSYKNGHNFQEQNYTVQNDFRQLKDVENQNLINNLKLEAERAKQCNDTAKIEKITAQLQNILQSIQPSSINTKIEPEQDLKN